MTTTRRALAAAAAITLLVAACGDDDGSVSETEPATPEDTDGEVFTEVTTADADADDGKTDDGKTDTDTTPADTEPDGGDDEDDSIGADTESGDDTDADGAADDADTDESDDEDEPGDDDGNSGDEAVTAPPTEAGAEATARSFTETMLSGGSTYPYLTADCQARYTPDGWDAELETVLEFAESFTGIPFAEMTVGAITISEFEPERALVAVEIIQPDGERFDDEAEPSEILYENGAWRIPDCEVSGLDESDASGLQLEDEESKRDETHDGEIDEPVQVDGLDVTVSSIGYETDEPDLVRVDLRVENQTSDEKISPEVVVICIDGDRGSVRFGTDPDLYEPFAELAPGAVEEGFSLVRIPEDCVDPVVRVEVLSFEAVLAADFALPAP